jgi:hypothetical protein
MKKKILYSFSSKQISDLLSLTNAPPEVDFQNLKKGYTLISGLRGPNTPLLPRLLEQVANVRRVRQIVQENDKKFEGRKHQTNIITRNA